VPALEDSLARMAVKLAWLEAKADRPAVSSVPWAWVDAGAAGGAVGEERKETARWTTAVAEGAAKTEPAMLSPPFLPAAPAVTWDAGHSMQ
jgi:hypothetical protein